MLNDVERVLISEEELDKKVREIAAQITKEYEGKELVIIGILKGSMMFVADLVKRIELPMELEFIAVSSYGKESETSGIVTLKKDIDTSIQDKHVIVVEDIVDSGYTLKYLKELLSDRKAASVKICTLLSKPSRRKAEIELDYTGFEIPDEFVIGYGLDYAERYRNLPYVGILKRSVYES